MPENNNNNINNNYYKACNVFLFLLFVFGLPLKSITSAKSASLDIELDIGWEFDSRSTEGWGNATSEVIYI